MSEPQQVKPIMLLVDRTRISDYEPDDMVSVTKLTEAFIDRMGNKWGITVREGDNFVERHAADDDELLVLIHDHMQETMPAMEMTSPSKAVLVVHTHLQGFHNGMPVYGLPANSSFALFFIRVDDTWHVTRPEPEILTGDAELLQRLHSLFE